MILEKNQKPLVKVLVLNYQKIIAKSLYIPEGFAHAYYSFSKLNVIYYKLSNYYHPEYEDGILWNDKLLKNKWPVKNPMVSKKDKKLKTFSQFKKIYKGL